MANTNFATSNLIGARFDAWSSDAKFDLGTVASGNDGSEWVYVQADAGGVTAAGYVVLIDESYAADMIDTTNTASAFGQAVGVASAAATANYYGWVQRKGTASIRVAASCAANAAINSTGTAGQLDDDASTGAEVINGIVLTTANGGAAGTAEGVLSYPNVGATL
ncbi:hypothetical protein [Thalassospira marina]|uniref:Uncharacterized protein n=1 Tax=Thalassospira marina TaxID=2048283 RepID=A0A2N3KY56_9PROT|nr:hypothetical protein [Thalassospira marina]PKR55406.1 hypothetical protein COO20_04345 [Thalassospira marina]